jgi:hypothetical protein
VQILAADINVLSIAAHIDPVKFCILILAKVRKNLPESEGSDISVIFLSGLGEL